MLRNALSLLLINVLILTSAAIPTGLAAPKQEKEAQRIEKVKAGVAKLGTGPDALADITLRDQTKLSGYISDVMENAFVITDAKTSQSTTVAYSEVERIKGHNRSSGKKVAIIVAVGAGAAVLIVILSKLFGEE